MLAFLAPFYLISVKLPFKQKHASLCLSQFLCKHAQFFCMSSVCLNKILKFLEERQYILQTPLKMTRTCSCQYKAFGKILTILAEKHGSRKYVTMVNFCCQTNESQLPRIFRFYPFFANVLSKPVILNVFYEPITPSADGHLH